MDNTLIVDKLNLDMARNICGDIEESELRSRAVSNVFSAKIAKDFLGTFDVDIESGLHNVSILLKECEIADIYVKGLRIEVRVAVEGESFSVPKYHYDKGILPYAYMFINIKSDLSEVKLLGFILANKVNFLEESSDYCEIPHDIMMSSDDFLRSLSTVISEEQEFDDLELELNMFDFVDGRLAKNDLPALLRMLFVNKKARLKLINIIKTQSIFNYLSTESNIGSGLITEMQNDEKFDSGSDVSVQDLERLLEEDSHNVQTSSYNSKNVAYELSSQEQIEGLFVNDLNNSEALEGEMIASNLKKKQKSILPFIIFLLIFGGAGYYVYSQYFSSSLNLSTIGNLIQKNDNSVPVSKKDVKVKEQMPIESIENEKKVDVVPQTELLNEDTAAIPVIEQNLGVSISVSNLSASWDVPASYLSNNSVQKYFVKIGKIIQLNLKSELLLFNKQPMTNKVSLEVEFDKNLNKFKVKKIIASSGENSIDNVITETVNAALQIELKTNMNVFKNLSGNPVLTINL